MNPKNGERYSFEDLVAMMAALRDPDNGCPWDLEQNFQSILPYTLEEAYEVADAIDRGNIDDLREELGDLLLQPVYHAQMAREAGHFDIEQVIHELTDKMIKRHPHVFGEQAASTAEDVNAIWEIQKAAEKTTNKPERSLLDSVTKGLPALLRAHKLQKKAAKVGFTWANIEQAYEKLDEELAELREAQEGTDKSHLEDELGDVLFALTNISRMNDINPEEALRKACNKFYRRFKGIEEILQFEDKNFETLTLDQMMQYWVKSKQKEVK